MISGVDELIKGEDRHVIWRKSRETRRTDRDVAHRLAITLKLVSSRLASPNFTAYPARRLTTSVAVFRSSADCRASHRCNVIINTGRTRHGRETGPAAPRESGEGEEADEEDEEGRARFLRRLSRTSSRRCISIARRKPLLPGLAPSTMLVCFR